MHLQSTVVNSSFLHKELRRLIEFKLLTPVFQPIMAVENTRIIGYEALIRGPDDSPLHKPDSLFAVARESRLLAALEFACREVSCERFAELNLPGKLFLNMSPISFTDSQYRDGVTREILQRVGLSAERLVFELTESQPLDELDLLCAASDHFQRQGFAVALDDLGAGYAGLRVWSELCPDYVKIDRHFISGIDKDPVKREFVRAILDIAHRMGHKAIAEGIETAAEFTTLVAMGVDYAQGYFIARPLAQPAVELSASLVQLSGVSARRHQDHFTRRVSEIVVDSAPVAPSTTAETLVKMFRADVRLTCVPVVDQGKPLGMVSRAEILNVFSRRFAHELYAQKPVAEFVSPLSIIVDINTDLKTVGQLISEDPQQNLSVDFIVSDNNQYVGVGKVRDLLRSITEEKLRAARHSNPLTQLPGNVPLYEWVDHLLLNKTTFVVAYCDINHFKPFNDAFGYTAGDEVIVNLGRILCEAIDSKQDFVGHVGGDDFILVFCAQNWQERCEQVLAEFARMSASLLPPDNAEFWSADRQGRRKKFGVLTLAIGAVEPDLEYCKTHHHVSQLLAEAKQAAKQEGGNSLFLSRRRQPSLVHGS
ncbi:bifunctional diguanylate cyclase/phosphodiesterase [Cellvibrio fontiphilus]|uniref:Bifunctional diguanylate cyclase/phosphodiesterase n=1 Tax=Cellvibrio fontiphilus TaxID=1815559 RepID=A0ABV7FG92_9GAMM